MRMRERAPGQMNQTDAFWQPILRMQTALVAFACGMVGDAELARDITQDTFVDAWRAARSNTPPFEAPDDLTGIRRWLFTVAYRHALKHLRRRKIVTWEPLDEQAAWSAALPTLPRFEDALAEAEALRIALRSIEPEDAACFLLQAVHGFSTAEIATIVDIRPDAARKRLSRARQRLRDAYCAQSTQPPTPLPHEGQQR